MHPHAWQHCPRTGGSPTTPCSESPSPCSVPELAAASLRRQRGSSPPYLRFSTVCCSAVFPLNAVVLTGIQRSVVSQPKSTAAHPSSRRPACSRRACAGAFVGRRARPLPWHMGRGTVVVGRSLHSCHRASDVDPGQAQAADSLAYEHRSAAQRARAVAACLAGSVGEDHPAALPDLVRQRRCRPLPSRRRGEYSRRDGVTVPVE